MSKQTGRFRAVFAGLMALASTSATADASLIGAYSGNTSPYFQAISGSSAAGFLDFAVFNTSGGSVGDTYGTGFAGFDTALTAAGLGEKGVYLYLFEVSNASNSNLTQTEVGVPTSGDLSVLSTGVLQTGLTLNFGGAINGASFFGPSATAPSNPSSFIVGATGTAIVAGSPTATPSLLSFTDGVPLGTLLTSTYSLAPGQTSYLFGYETNIAPTTFGAASYQGINDGAVSANGVVPVGTAGSVGPAGAAVPEPGPIALATIGGLAAVVGGVQRRTAKI